MSADKVPSRSEVMGWSPQDLAGYLKRMNLSGCDKAVIKNSISGSRFVNLSDNDLQKFPKLHAPMISKISSDISKKVERRGPFGIKPTPKYPEPDTAADVQGWGEDEFDEFDDDYESPYSGDEEGSGGDYESPTEDLDGSNDYEPPPSEPPDDLAHKLCPTLPIGDSDYIDNRDNHVSSRGPPPALCPRPPVSTLSAPSPRMQGESSSSKRDSSPHGGRPSVTPPQISRANKPGKDPGSNQPPVRGPHRNTVDRPSAHPCRPQPDDPSTRFKPPVVPPPSSINRSNSSVKPPPNRPQPDDPSTRFKPPVVPPPSSINRSNSSVKPPPNRFDTRREQTPDEALKHNTFPLQSKSLPPRPGLPGPPSRHGDSSLPAGSLPHKLHAAIAEQRSGSVGSDRPSRPPQPSAAATQELDPRWYVGKVTRGQAEGCLRRVRKDGAYLVRDSTRQQDNQPFTLMVFYQDKVYNIQIRQQNQNFLLGTGLKAQESFPSVSGIICHYSQSPLLLIDAKKRVSSQQNQCLLSDPAGHNMTGQNWS